MPVHHALGSSCSQHTEVPYTVAHTHQRHSQHQVAALKLTAVQGPTREVGLLWGFLPVFERCL